MADSQSGLVHSPLAERRNPPGHHRAIRDRPNPGDAMSALSDIVKTMLATPGSEHVLPHGLRLRYADDTWLHLYLSRNRVYPSQTEVRILMDVLAGLGVRGIQQRTD